MSGLERRSKGRSATPRGAPAVTAVMTRLSAGDNAGSLQATPPLDWSAIDGNVQAERHASIPDVEKRWRAALRHQDNSMLLTHGAHQRRGPAKRAERAETRKIPIKWASDEGNGYGQ